MNKQYALKRKRGDLPLPPAVKSVRDLILWQYAKIISESAAAGNRQSGFVIDRFKKLTSGEIQWSTSIREYIKEREKAEECIYCGLGGCGGWVGVGILETNP